MGCVLVLLLFWCLQFYLIVWFFFKKKGSAVALPVLFLWISALKVKCCRQCWLFWFLFVYLLNLYKNFIQEVKTQACGWEMFWLVQHVFGWAIPAYILCRLVHHWYVFLCCIWCPLLLFLMCQCRIHFVCASLSSFSKPANLNVLLLGVVIASQRECVIYLHKCFICESWR